MILARSLGIKQADFWQMTPFDLHIEYQAEEERIKRENRINLLMLNSWISDGNITFDDVMGYMQVKDLKFKSLEAFRGADGKIKREEYDKYIKEVVIPEKAKYGF